MARAPQAFPSQRQATCAGLRRRYYPPYLRDLVDYDYDDDRLPLAARIWLAAFTEEHYRGWRLANEAQVTRLSDLREAGASKQRLARRHADGVPVASSLERLKESEFRSVEVARTAAALLVEPAELSGRNVVEERLVEALDKSRRSASTRQIVLQRVVRRP